jgi:glutathione S-transferase
LHVSAWIDYLAFFGIDLGPFKALAAWRARCRERPAYARAMSG